ncbi:MAG: PQQ-binding-like beta-propeller repeat protein [Bdellovibrionota bacterium]
MKSLFYFSLSLIVASCTTLPKSQVDHSRFIGMGMVEIERNPRFDRGAALGSFAYPIRFSESDYFVGTLGGTFGRFHTPSGSFKWKKTFQIGVTSRPAIRGNRVYIGAMNGFVYCYDLNNGKEVWKKKLSAESLGNLVMGEEYLYVATSDNVLWALNIQTGDEQWTLRRPSPNAAYYWSLRGNTSGVLSPNKKILYLGFSDGVVVAVKALSGESLWERSFTRPGRFQDADTEPVLSPNGSTLYVALPDHSIQVLRTSDGASVDSFSESSGFVPLLNFKEDTITYTTVNGSVRKYSLSTKKLLWQLDLKNRGMGVEFYDLGNGELLMTSTHYGLHLIDAKKGTLIDEHYLGEGVLSRPVSDGSRIFVMTGRGRLAFIKLKNKT